MMRRPFLTKILERANERASKSPALAPRKDDEGEPLPYAHSQELGVRIDLETYAISYEPGTADWAINRTGRLVAEASPPSLSPTNAADVAVATVEKGDDGVPHGAKDGSSADEDANLALGAKAENLTDAERDRVMAHRRLRKMLASDMVQKEWTKHETDEEVRRLAGAWRTLVGAVEEVVEPEAQSSGSPPGTKPGVEPVADKNVADAGNATLPTTEPDGAASKGSGSVSVSGAKAATPSDAEATQSKPAAAGTSGAASSVAAGDAPLGPAAGEQPKAKLETSAPEKEAETTGAVADKTDISLTTETKDSPLATPNKPDSGSEATKTEQTDTTTKPTDEPSGVMDVD